MERICCFTLLPFYSSIVLGFFFFLFAMGILWLMDVVREKKMEFSFFFFNCLHDALFMVSWNIGLSILSFFQTKPNSRDEYFHARLPLWRVIRLTFKNYILGHTHVMTVHGLIILPILFIAFYYCDRKRLWKQEKVFVFLFVLNFFYLPGMPFGFIKAGFH